MLDALLIHVADGVVAAAADAYNFDDSLLAGLVDEVGEFFYIFACHEITDA